MAPHLHFNNYASAVLDPLPRDAVLLINYVSEIRALPPSTLPSSIQYIKYIHLTSHTLQL
jgi:hypothetical protein